MPGEWGNDPTLMPATPVPYVKRTSKIQAVEATSRLIQCHFVRENPFSLRYVPALILPIARIWVKVPYIHSTIFNLYTVLVYLWLHIHMYIFILHIYMCNTMHICIHTHTVIGRNPAPVDKGFSPWLIGFQHVSTMQGAGFLPMNDSYPPRIWTSRLHFSPAGSQLLGQQLANAVRELGESRSWGLGYS